MQVPWPRLGEGAGGGGWGRTFPGLGNMGQVQCVQARVQVCFLVGRKWDTVG